MDFTAIAAILVSISAVIVALKNIYNFIRKPKDMFDNYQDKQRDELMSDMREMIREEMQPLQEDILYRTEVLKLVLSTQIERIYWRGFKEKTIYLYNQESLNHLFEAYRRLGGNGYIEHLVTQMRTWEVIETKG